MEVPFIYKGVKYLFDYITNCRLKPVQIWMSRQLTAYSSKDLVSPQRYYNEIIVTLRVSQLAEALQMWPQKNNKIKTTWTN